MRFKALFALLLTAGCLVAFVAGVVCQSERPLEVFPASLEVYSHGGPGNDFQAQGTWVFANESQGWPNQITSIVCWKTTMSCQQTTAILTKEKHLFMNVSNHGVVDWSDSTLKLAASFGICTSTQIVVDLIHKQVRATRSTIDSQGTCAVADLDSKEMVMIGGFEAWKHQRKMEKLRRRIRDL